MLRKFNKRSFDKVFTRCEDPWRYSTSDYEKTKYLRQLEAIRKFSPQPQSILEISCAEGVFTDILSQAFPQAKITGVDISQIAIERAREKYKDRPNITFIEADAIQFVCRDLPSQQRFDVIIQSESLHYIFARLVFQRKLRSYWREIANRLEKEGIFVTAHAINIQTRFVLLTCYSILEKLCQQVWKAKYREWSDFRRRRIKYDVRVFRRVSAH
ncbi:class I SAM-dependent methyltransferase [Candidatus Acetothermia bacterium]|nr:class I SAM-dependent methyltransferase [Candidatus Acetothermia bacterium]MCI2426725.1 class I SAM-dependent methyltransferase [Candidatus Acetothermia bacterium]MCI2427319.1 class I SAM-dependent methyltransferase [Candidatus Acetothermia bacterium]MCI2428865.1 class I SAM-dependent methyltransferase [Candidatus Acetothermia bacterium]